MCWGFIIYIYSEILSAMKIYYSFVTTYLRSLVG